MKTRLLIKINHKAHYQDLTLVRLDNICEKGKKFALTNQCKNQQIMCNIHFVPGNFSTAFYTKVQASSKNVNEFYNWWSHRLS